MATEITYDEFTTRVKEYVGFDTLNDDRKELVTQVLEDLLEFLDEIRERGKFTSRVVKIFEIDENALFKQPEVFENFLLDNMLKVMFSGVWAAHTHLRPMLMMFYIIKHTELGSDTLFSANLFHQHELCDIYTGLHLGIYESGSFGGCSMICGQDYPFDRLNQKRLSTARNLRPLQGFNKEEAKQAFNDLIVKISATEKSDRNVNQPEEPVVADFA
ncbi:hypothetical protein LCS82_08600 [Vibrio harveyi]|uniref:hypothetical protein n=1 Tax=Vibrio harveyi TaxID=669 RepID=UPI003BB5D5DB